MTITSQAVFTFGDVKSDYKRPYAKLFYDVTVFNRKNNKTAHIEVPFIFYENIADFLEECLYSCDPVDRYCTEQKTPKTVELLAQREFFQTQTKILKEIALDLDAIFSEIIFGGETTEQNKKI